MCYLNFVCFHFLTLLLLHIPVNSFIGALKILVVCN